MSLHSNQKLIHFSFTISFVINIIIEQLMASKQQIFDRKKEFIGWRLETCLYRFQQILATRQRQIFRLTEDYNNEDLQNKLKQLSFDRTDYYINCLRNEYDEQLPQALVPVSNEFKSMVQFKLSPAWELQDYRRQLAGAIFDYNSKA